jgi:hypothetical protein
MAGYQRRLLKNVATADANISGAAVMAVRPIRAGFGADQDAERALQGGEFRRTNR